MNHIVLYEPEIPQNAGNIIRTAVANQMTLHFIRPLGFHLRGKDVIRSAVNYLDQVEHHVHNTFEDFMKTVDGDLYFITRYGSNRPDQIDVADKVKNHYFIFGSESSGMPKRILSQYLDRCIRIPMHPAMRSLNLSNSVAIVAYEVMRQQNFPNLSDVEPENQKGKDYLKQP